MVDNSPDGKYCPATGQACIHGLSVFTRDITLRRWTGGSIKAKVCSQECAQQWAGGNDRIITGDSTHYDCVKKRTQTVLIIQHPDQVLGNRRT